MKMTRRGFLGGLVAVSALPSWADDPSLFAGRGKYERLVIDYVDLKVGATKPFSVLHISDTHLTEAYPHEGEALLNQKAKRAAIFGGRQEEALRDTLAWAKRNVEYVVHTGDLIDWQSEANLDLVKKYTGEAFFGSLGNHEFKTVTATGYNETRDEVYKDKTRAKLAAAYPFDVSFQAQVVNGVNFVTLDDVYGYVLPAQVEKFMAEAKKGLPIVLCMHVPFHTERIWRATVRYWRNANRKFGSEEIPPPGGDRKCQLEDPTTREFIAYLKSEKLLRAILCGHEHFTMQDRFSPTAVECLVGGNFMFHGQEVLFT